MAHDHQLQALVDDHEAATASGARSVLVTTGASSRVLLERTGAPVVNTLLEAAELASPR